MNNILQLKGQFQKRKAPSGFGPVNLPKGKSVSVEHVLKLKKQLQDIVLFWSKEKIIKGALVSVHYRKVVAKSNRIQILLSENGKHPNKSIRGSKVLQKDIMKRINGFKNIFHLFFVNLIFRCCSKSYKQCIKICKNIFILIINRSVCFITNDQIKMTTGKKLFPSFVIYRINTVYHGLICGENTSRHIIILFFNQICTGKKSCIQFTKTSFSPVLPVNFYPPEKV